MALETQLIPIPISGGLAESQDPTSAGPGSFLALDNLTYDKSGSLRRRYGFDRLSGYGTPIQRLDAFGSELVATDAKATLASQRMATDALVPRSTVAPASLSRAQAVRSHLHVASGHQVVWGDYVVTTYRLDAVGEEGTPQGLYWRVTEAETGALIVPDALIPGSAEGDWAPDEHSTFVAPGGQLVVVWCEPPETPATQAARFRISVWSDPAAPPVQPAFVALRGDAPESVGIDAWDACPSTSPDEIVIAYALGGDPTLVRVGLNGSLLLRTTLDEVDVGYVRQISIAATPLDATYPVSRLALLVSSHMDIAGERLWVTVASIAPASLDVAWTLDVSDRSFPYKTLPRLALTVASDGQLWCAWEARPGQGEDGEDESIPDEGVGGTFAVSVSTSGEVTPATGVFPAPRIPAPQVAWHVGLASRPFLAPDGRVFVWAGGAATEGTEGAIRGHVLLCLSDRTETTLRLDGVALGLDGYQDRPTHLPSVQRLGETRFSVPALVHTTTTTAGLDTVVVDFAPAKDGLWDAAQLAGLLHHAGSVLTSYDGTTAAEAGFHHAPVVLSSEVLPDGNIVPPPQPLDPDYTYGYVAIAAWWDARGNLHVSEPSPIHTQGIEHADGLSKIRLRIAVPALTRRGREADGQARDVRILLYRTPKATPEVWYQTRSVATVVRGEAVVEIVDDEDVVTGPVPYTSGGVLESVMPPPMKAICAAKNRLWGVSAEDPKGIWFTQTLVQGEAPRWHPGLSVRIDDAPLGATAIAALDDKVLIFTASSVYWLAGDGPEDTGMGGSFGGPYLLSTSAGCIEPRSVVTYEGGVIFQASGGMYQIGRGLQLSYIGAGIETTLAAYPEVLSGMVDVARGRAIWLCKGSEGSRWLVLDFMHGQGSWLTWSITDWRPHTETAQALWGGRHAYAGSLNSEPFIALESDGVKDAGGLISPTVLETVWMRPDAVLERHQRVRHIVITGRKEGPHKATVELMTDYDETGRQSREFDLTDASEGPKAAPVERLDVHVAPQKCSAIKLRITTALDGYSPDETGRAGMVLRGITIEAGVMQGRAKLAASNRK